MFTYRLYNIKTVILLGKPLPIGQNRLTFSFVPDAPGFGKPATLSLAVNDVKVAEGTVPTSPPVFYSPGGNTFDVGVDTGAPAGNYPEDAPVGNPAMDLKIDSVTVAAGKTAKS